MDKAKVPKCDWPEKLVYQTPGAHRILSKSSTMSDIRKEKLITNEDSSLIELMVQQ